MNAKLHSLNLDDHRWIEAICTTFESNWEPNSHDFASLLRETDGLLRATLLCELISLDIELRRSDGQTPTEDDYRSTRELADVGLVTSDFWSHVSKDTSVGKELELLSSRYEVIEKLGTGGIGVVYRVYDRRNQRTIALKLLRSQYQNVPEAVKRFEFEGLVTGTLQHPGIPPIYDRGTLDDGTPYFTMKVVEGETLNELFKKRTKNASDSAHLHQLFAKIAQTVAYAHRQGIIHRDLKPQNVMVGSFGEVQVMDWGLAKRIGETPQSNQRPDREEPSDGLTAVGDFIGTPRHMSPEQSRGDSESHSPRMDVFGLGTILFQILTGKTLYPGDSAREAVAKIQKGELADAYAELDQLSFSALNSLCRRCLSVDPKDRPANAAEVADHTEDYLAELQRELNRAEIEKTNAEFLHREQQKRLRSIALVSILSMGLISAATYMTYRQWQKSERAAEAERASRIVAERESESTRQINDFLTSVLSATRPEELGRKVTLRDVLNRAIPELEGRFDDQPEVEGSLRLTLGETFRWLNAVDLAEDQLRMALLAFERSGAVDEREILRAKNELSELLLVHDRSSDQPEALELRREVVERSTELFGESDSLTLNSMIGLGKVLTHQSDHKGAIDWLLKTQEIINETPELADFDTRPLTLNLARAYKHLDQTERAEAMYKSLLNDPESSPIIRMPALKQLGELYHWDEKLTRAEKTLFRALELHQSELGRDHRLTLSTMRKYFRVLDDAKEHERLLALADESIELHTQWDGIARSSVMEARKMKARALAGVGQLDEAEAFLRESVALAITHRGEDSRQTEKAQQELEKFLAKRRNSEKTP